MSVGDTDTDADVNADGVFADAAVSLAGPVALVGAVDWAKHTSQAFGFNQSLTSLAASGGVRLRLGARRIVPFVQLLVGGERRTLAIDRVGSDASTHLLVQPGGGVAVRLFQRLSVVGQLDWRHVRRLEDEDGVRLAVGARLRLH